MVDSINSLRNGLVQRLSFLAQALHPNSQAHLLPNYTAQVVMLHRQMPRFNPQFQTENQNHFIQRHSNTQ